MGASLPTVPDGPFAHGTGGEPHGMATAPPERSHADTATPDEERTAAVEEFVPATPREEVREVARGETPRTPFSLVVGITVLVLGFAALVTGIVVLAMWLA
jgi:hypothetical protein